MQALLSDSSCRIRPVIVHTYEYSYLNFSGSRTNNGRGELSTPVYTKAVVKYDGNKL
jgi:hypothetical protein